MRLHSTSGAGTIFPSLHSTSGAGTVFPSLHSTSGAGTIFPSEATEFNGVRCLVLFVLLLQSLVFCVVFFFFF